LILFNTTPYLWREFALLRGLIHHYGLLAKGNRVANIARARELLAAPAPSKEPEPYEASPDDQRSCRANVLVVVAA
jgi:hypothetical protein